MRLRDLFLAACLMFATPTIAAQDKPVAVEYNIASCGGQDFTVIHAVLSDDRTKITFGDFLTGPTEIKKVDEPLVFDYKEQPKDEKGFIKYSASAIYKEKKLEVFGARLGNRIIGVMTVDNKLGHVYYGFIGPETDITVGLDDNQRACEQLHDVSQDDMIGILVQFLIGGSVQPTPVNKS